MKLMNESGCRLLDVGFESGSNYILNNIKKGVTIDQLRTFSGNAKKAKLKLLADFVIGFQGETKDTAEQTIMFAKEVKPDLLQVAVATPIPGTKFYLWCKENGYLLTEDMEESIDEKGFQRCIISYPWLTKVEIEALVDRSLREYYLSSSFIYVATKNISGKNGMHELKTMARSANSFLKYLVR